MDKMETLKNVHNGNLMNPIASCPMSNAEDIFNSNDQINLKTITTSSKNTITTTTTTATTTSVGDTNANIPTTSKTLTYIKNKRNIFNWIRSTTTSSPSTSTTNSAPTTPVTSPIKKSAIFYDDVQQLKNQEKENDEASKCPNPNNSQYTNLIYITDKNCDCVEKTSGTPPLSAIQSPSQKRSSLSRAKSQVADFTVGTLREFRGVQSLRHLWTKRIIANEDPKLKSSTSSSDLNKSISCLADATKENSLKGRSRTVTKRAQSLHDLGITKVRDSSPSPIKNQISLDAETNDCEIYIDSFHKVKDNFYKYKTAEQAARHKEKHKDNKYFSKTRRSEEDSHFPAIRIGAKNQHIQWAKREDIILKRPEEKDNNLHNNMEEEDCVDKMIINEIKTNCGMSLSTSSAMDFAKPLSASNEVDSSINKSKNNNNNNYNDKNDILNKYRQNDKERPLSSVERRHIYLSKNSNLERQRYVTSLPNPSRPRNFESDTSSSTVIRDSIDTLSITSTSTGSASTGRQLKRSGSSANRKYSFKTHSHSRSYHLPRKMNTNSKVAKLTQQFNEIIQKDKKILEEVKRKNGVLMSRNGHVYKIVPQNSDRNAKISSNSGSPAVSRSSSKAGDSSNSIVLRTIKKFESGVAFESNSEKSIVDKPKLPEKSAEVLKKKNELITKNISTPIHPKGKRPMMALPLKNSDKKLEVVKEEGKTPMESEDKNISTNNKQTKEGKESFDYSKSTDSSEDIKGNPLETKDFEKCSTSYESLSNISQHVDTCNIVLISKFKDFIPTSSSIEEVTSVSMETLMQNPEIKNQDSNAFSGDEPDVVNEEKVKQHKRKYAAIYEKFRFPFKSSTNKKVSKNTPSNQSQKENVSAATSPNEKEFIDESLGAIKVNEPQLATPTDESNQSKHHEDNSLLQTYSPSHENVIKSVPTTTIPTATQPNADKSPEAKILDALDAVDQKLKDLTIDIEGSAIILRKNDDFEQQILPNNSFIYQTVNKGVKHISPLLITQAVNVALVNSIEGEQMIMEQKELQFIKSQQDLEQLSSYTTIEEDPMYEPINDPKVCSMPSSLKPQVPDVSSTCLQSQSFNGYPSNIEIIDSCEEAVESRIPLSNCHDNSESTLEDIYQSLDEVKSTIVIKSNMQKDCSTFSDYESIAGSREQTTKNVSSFYGYEEFEPSNEEPLPATTPIVRNTNDELPELPKPKRRLPKSPSPCKRPPKPKHIFIPSENDEEVRLCQPVALRPHVEDDQHYYADDDENIYDTIKSSDCYESIQSSSLKVKSFTATDSLSLTSNCYESISNYKLLKNDSLPNSSGPEVILLNKTVIKSNSSGSGASNTAGSRTGSSLTISSDHKTNSLYGGSLSAISMAFVGRRCSTGSGSVDRCPKSNSHNDIHSDSHRSISENMKVCHYRHSVASSSENSDEWIDISDTEQNDVPKRFPPVKQKFIVVRSKAHRSPDWSKRVRDKRLNQKKAFSCIEDDSDHYYESLSPLNSKSHSSSEVQYINNELGPLSGKHSSARFSPNVRSSQRSKRCTASAHVLGASISDDYDSFDTDTDEIYETEENMRNHNDSGVDICNTKLPEPPLSAKPKYGIVKKFKDFISNKKSPSSSSSKQNSNSQGKLYDSSQFYVESNVYENTPKAKSKNTKSLKKSKVTEPPTATTSNSKDDVYEKTEYRTQRPAPPPPIPPTINIDETKALSSSEKNLCSNSAVSSNGENPTAGTSEVPVPTLRTKPKSAKSFKSRFRKSLVGSSFDSKALSSLQPTRSTFYIEDPSHNDSGELDSGFSEKASSGDLPTTTNSTISTATASSSLGDALNFCTVRKNKKESKSASLMQRRRTTIGIRPHDPPPPPPASTGKPPAPTTSWYAECGVFKTGNGYDDGSYGGSRPGGSHNGSLNCNDTTYYAEAGLYQTTSGNSVASSSGSSGVSTGNEAGLGDGDNDDEMHHTMFSNEPLYQIYSAAKLESISRDMEEQDSSTDGYEEIGRTSGYPNKGNKGNKESSQKRARPTALQLIEPKNGPSRTLWCEISEVINSEILATLTSRERALQEAKFEIITSEASYLKSLNLLRLHFMNNPSFRDPNILSSKDRKALFSYIVPVHECSERLLTELESCWQDNIMLLGLSKRIYDIAEKHFHVYISFCEHQGRMDRTLRQLKQAKGPFSQHLDTLEASPTCCGLNLLSFLMLPMQRITRLPLLIDAVFSKLNANDDEYDNWKLTMAIMNKIVKQCNEAANRCEQAYEIERISRHLEFPTNIRALAIAPVGVPAQGSKPRYLVKKGELTHLIWRGDDAKLTFGKKFTKMTIYAFLFSDLLVLTKRKSEEQFIVFDYCPRNLLTISSGQTLPQLPTKDMGNSGKHLILMTLLENYEGKTIEMVLSCPSISEQERWLQAMRPPEAETPGEKLYESWDCPQVLVKHAYESKEPDVLSLEVGDVINVSRKLPDGWYQGERIRDGAVGWFPGSYTEEVNSAHVKARNLKQRYRLLTFTATYLESQKRK